MPLIHDSEKGDFQATILNAGLSVDDFELAERRDADGPKEGYFPTGTVTVTYTPTKIAREYRGGHLSTWTAEFDDDLNAGEFSQP